MHDSHDGAAFQYCQLSYVAGRIYGSHQEGEETAVDKAVFQKMEVVVLEIADEAESEELLEWEKNRDDAELGREFEKGFERRHGIVVEKYVHLRKSRPMSAARSICMHIISNICRPYLTGEVLAEDRYLAEEVTEM